MFRVSRPAIYSTALAAAFVISVSIAAGLTTTQVATDIQAQVAEARTVAVLRATATHVAELKASHLVISATLAPTSEVEQMVNTGSAMIPLSEAPTAQVEALDVPVTIYPQSLQPTLTPVPPGVATVNANIESHHSTGTPMATDAATATDTPLAFPINTETPRPEQTPAEAVVIVTLEMMPTATYAPTLTIEPPPTPQPTDAPKATAIPTPVPTPQPVATDTVEVTPIPLLTETATQAPTVEPSATATSVLVSPLATPTEEATAAP